ncbi:hypothetical protein HY642_01405 [Candidatus Woesearchaeota archaeon]|nr:hypothetical protein [Candidatus Woesearchaeota archaeon]
MFEIPSYGLRAYALLYSRHGLREPFMQTALDWIISQSMRKKVFSLLLRAGWIRKVSRQEYACISPDEVFKHLLDFKVPDIMRSAERQYAFTGLSAIEIWSDYSYVQRGREKSPYFIKVERKDVAYWKKFFNAQGIPNYVGQGATIGEYVVIVPVSKVEFVEKDGLRVEPLTAAMADAAQNEMFAYAYKYMKQKYGGK